MHQYLKACCCAAWDQKHVTRKKKRQLRVFVLPKYVQNLFCHLFQHMYTMCTQIRVGTEVQPGGGGVSEIRYPTENPPEPNLKKGGVLGHNGSSLLHRS